SGRRLGRTNRNQQTRINGCLIQTQRQELWQGCPTDLNFASLMRFWNWIQEKPAPANTTCVATSIFCEGISQGTRFFRESCSSKPRPNWPGQSLKRIPLLAHCQG